MPAPPSALLAASLSEEERDERAALAGAPAAAATAKRGARAAQAMALAASVLALASLVLLGAVALRLRGGAGGGLSPETPTSGLIGLASAREGDGHGWYRVHVSSMVRQGVEMDSDEVKILPPGSLVYVREVQGRRAHVLKPVRGWMSLRTADGFELLRPDAGVANASDAFYTPEMRAAQGRLDEARRNLTAMQHKLQGAVKKLRSQPLVKHVEKKSQEISRAVTGQAPKLEKAIQQELSKVVRPDGAKHFLDNLGKQPGFRGIAQGAKENEMALEDAQRMEAELEDPVDAAPAKVGADHGEPKQLAEALPAK